jgi:hypothetical protein
MPSADIDTKKNSNARMHKKVHAHVRHHYFRVMPNKKHHRVAIWVVFLVSSTMIALQMLYPLDQAVPFARLQNTNVGWWTDEELAGELATRFDKTSITVKAQSGEGYTMPLKNAGAEQQASASIETLSNYPYWQRFIPFSILWQMPHVTTSSMVFSPSVIGTFSDSAATKLSYDSTNASLAIKNGELVATDDKNGQVVRSDDVRRILEVYPDYTLGSGNTLTVESKELEPTTTSADFDDVRSSAERALGREIKLVVGDAIISPTDKQRALWLEISSDKAGKPLLALNKKAVKKYIGTLDATYGSPAGTTKISIVNGIETGRSVGKAGKQINSEVAVASIQSAMFDDEVAVMEVNLTFVPVQPTVEYNGRYTASEEGLRAYVRDQTSSGAIAISIKQLSGKGWAAEGGANTSRVSASTFKLYVALYLFDQMNKGRIGWNDGMLDTTVSGCFDRMTIASTNPCAYDWLSRWGRTNVNNFVYSNGFSRGTTFTNPQATQTTANDLLKFMIGLENGSLIGGAHRDRLLHSLHVHPYRYGVPTGSSGDTYDKVGFLWDYVNDAAIVRHSGGTYAISVMTKGYGYAKIATITREVEKIMYP